jgi:hypothetical protein
MMSRAREITEREILGQKSQADEDTQTDAVDNNNNDDYEILLIKARYLCSSCASMHAKGRGILRDKDTASLV